MGFFASSSAPSDLVLPTLDLVRTWPVSGPTLLSGFQSPLERAALDVLIAAEIPTVAALPASVSTSRLPKRLRRAISRGTLALLWEAGATGARASERTAESRNQIILGIVAGLLVVSGGTASRAYRMARAGAASGLPLLCHAHPRERDLLLLGAEPHRGSLEWLNTLSAMAQPKRTAPPSDQVRGENRRDPDDASGRTRLQERTLTPPGHPRRVPAGLRDLI